MCAKALAAPPLGFFQGPGPDFKTLANIVWASLALGFKEGRKRNIREEKKKRREEKEKRREKRKKRREEKEKEKREKKKKLFLRASAQRGGRVRPKMAIFFYFPLLIRMLLSIPGPPTNQRRFAPLYGAP